MHIRILVFVFIVTFSVTANAWWWDRGEEESDPVKPYEGKEPDQRSTEATRVRESYRFELRGGKDERLTPEKPEDETEKPAGEKKEGAIQYKSIKKRDISCDIGTLYKNTPDGGLDVTVSAIAKGKGSDFRKWKVKDIKLDIDGDAIRPGEAELFYSVKESVFRVPAAVVFAAIGTQYERYSSSCSGGEVCPVTGQPTGGREQGAISRGIDKAGMAAGLGLLVAQAKGEITGSKCVFKLDKDTADRLSKKNGKIRIVFENPERHRTETVEFPVPPPATYGTLIGTGVVSGLDVTHVKPARTTPVVGTGVGVTSDGYMIQGAGEQDFELPYTSTTDAPPIEYVVTPGEGGSQGAAPTANEGKKR
jgi:hypothetical protein